MSTNDVPGANPQNRDELAMGCWAEHHDGSLMLVESTEGGRVIYSMFDMSRDPPIEYRDAMPESTFKVTFTWDPAGKKAVNERWTWHDKTPFPWDRIIKGGARDGSRLPSADHLMTAAERVALSRSRLRRRNYGDDHLDEPFDDDTAARRVAESLRLRGQEFDRSTAEHRMERVVRRMEGMWDRIASALERLPGAAKRSKATQGKSARR